jgi:hypothetical protein
LGARLRDASELGPEVLAQKQMRPAGVRNAL